MDFGCFPLLPAAPKGIFNRQAVMQHHLGGVCSCLHLKHVIPVQHGA
jgi:hypothetical protein